MNILFVCTGNTCRSPMASEILKNMEDDVPLLRGNIKVDSCGTFAAEDMPAAKEAIEVMDAMGMDIKKHRSKQFTVEHAEWADIILTMEAKHIEQIEAMAPIAEGYTHTLLGYADGVDGYPGDASFDIPDPFGEPYEEYVESAEILLGGIKKAVTRLTDAFSEED